MGVFGERRMCCAVVQMEGGQGGRGGMWKDELELFLRVPGGMAPSKTNKIPIGILILRLSCDSAKTPETVLFKLTT